MQRTRSQAMDMTEDQLSGWLAVSGPSETAPTLPTGVVTFLLSDVEGSTRLWQGDEAEMGAAIARHYELLDAAIVLHNGVRPVEQGEGDSVVGAFAHPTDALAAALDAQRAFAAEPWPPGRELRIRIALHTGQAQLRGNDYYVGRAVIRCARLRAVAHGGQTVLSAATRDLVGDRLPGEVVLRDLGEHRLKDLGEPERVWQLCHPELPSEFDPLNSLHAVRTNLPAQLTSFVGRSRDVAELRELLGSARLLVLTGSGGCGKTRLAVHAAAEVTDHYPDGVWWVELGPLADPDLVAVTVARALGVRENETKPILDTLCERAADLDALVVLDNCEHVIDAVAALVERLLAAAPAVRILATSREQLGVPGETTWRVPSLDDDTATRLFVDRAAAVRHGFAPEPAELATITAICSRLDGIPLAIELAAARARMMPPAKIAAALDDRFRLLTGGGRRVMARQQTLELSVAWSHDLLAEDERVLLRRLSVFVGGFTLEVAEAVCGYGPIDDYAVLDLLARLVDKSLVQVDHDAEGRYRLLETIRLYAAQRLIAVEEADALRGRHLRHFLELAEEMEPLIVRPHGPTHLAQLEDEHDNLRSAMEWAEATGATDDFQRLSTALTVFWELHGHMQAGGDWATRAVAMPGEPCAIRARALWGGAHLAIYRGDANAMEHFLSQALPMAEEVGDRQAQARILNSTGLLQAMAATQDALPVAHATLDRSIALARELGDEWAIADGLKMKTCAHMFADDFDGLERVNGELLTMAQLLGNQFFLGWYQVCDGWMTLRRGDFPRARAALGSATSLDTTLGNATTAGMAEALLGDLEACSGQPEDAEARMRAFLNRRPQMGRRNRGLYPDDFGGWYAIPVLGRILLGRGEPGEAQDLVGPIADGWREIGATSFFSWTMWVLGAALTADGAHDDAAGVLAEARAASADVGSPWLLGNVDHHLGLLARERGDLALAEDHHHRALSARVSLGLRPGVVESLEALAGLAAEHESFAEGTRLYAAAFELRKFIGLARWRAELASHDADLARLRSALGSSGFETVWGEGAQLTAASAVSYATRARGERKRPSVGWASLTPTEVEVVRLVVQGLTNPQIGERLFIGRATVKTHLAHVFAKVGVNDRTELAVEASRRNI